MRVLVWTVVVMAVVVGIDARGVASAPAALGTEPQQVHLALTSNLAQRTVSYATLQPVNESTVWYGTNATNLNRASNCTRRPFTDGGAWKRTIYLHECVMSDLKYETTYFYRVGEGTVVSRTFNFTTWRKHRADLTLAVFGDMGVVNARSLSPLKKELADGNYDMVLHVGGACVDKSVMFPFFPRFAGLAFCSCGCGCGCGLFFNSHVAAVAVVAVVVVVVAVVVAVLVVVAAAARAAVGGAPQSPICRGGEAVFVSVPKPAAS